MYRVRLSEALAADDLETITQLWASSKGDRAFASQLVGFAASPQMISHLSNMGVDLDWPDEHGVSPLHRQAQGRHLENMRRLLEHGADPALWDTKSRTALHWLCIERIDETQSRDLVECAKLLLSVGNSPNAVDYYGQTPLHMAILLRVEPLVGLLLSAGADPRLRGPGGCDSRHLAEFDTHIHLLLEEHMRKMGWVWDDPKTHNQVLRSNEHRLLTIDPKWRHAISVTDFSLIAGWQLQPIPQVLWTFRSEQPSISGVAFTPSGDHFWLSVGGKVIERRAWTRPEVAVEHHSVRGASRIAASPVGDLLAVCRYPEEVHFLRSSDWIHVVEAGEDPTVNMRFSSSGSVFVIDESTQGCMNLGIHMIDSNQTVTESNQIEWNTCAYSLCFATGDKAILIWEPVALSQADNIIGHLSSIDLSGNYLWRAPVYRLGQPDLAIASYGPTNQRVTHATVEVNDSEIGLNFGRVVRVFDPNGQLLREQRYDTPIRDLVPAAQSGEWWISTTGGIASIHI